MALSVPITPALGRGVGNGRMRGARWLQSSSRLCNTPCLKVGRHRIEPLTLFPPLPSACGHVHTQTCMHVHHTHTYIHTRSHTHTEHTLTRKQGGEPLRKTPGVDPSLHSHTCACTPSHVCAHIRSCCHFCTHYLLLAIILIFNFVYHSLFLSWVSNS